MTSQIYNEYAYENAIRRNIIANAQKTFFKKEHSHEVINWLHANADHFEFASNLLRAFNDYGKLTDRQFDAVTKLMEKQEIRKAEWEAKRLKENEAREFVGLVGARFEFVVEIKKIISFETYYGYNWINILEDSNGNQIVYKGSSDLGRQGAKVKFKAQVKSHELYNGAKQTIITRPTKIQIIEEE